MSDFPSWHDLPLRLDNSQIENPVDVIISFFECFHLKDIRTEIENMYAYSLGVESEKSKHLYYAYTRILQLIEAAWIIRNRINDNFGDRFTLINPVPPEIFLKKTSPFELVKSDPARILSEILNQYTLEDLRHCIKGMAFVATNDECNAYGDAENRRILNIFIEDFHLYIEAVFILHTKINKHPEESAYDNIVFLSKEQQYNHRVFISSFFEKFPIVYLRRELDDWLEAGISFTKPWPDKFNVSNVLESYKIFLCLIEAGWLLAPYN